MEESMKRLECLGKAVTTLVIVLLTMTFAGCASLPEVEREFVRPTGVSPAYRKVFDKVGESIPQRMKRDGIPGLSVAVLDRRSILWSAGYGRTGRGKQPVTPETLFSIQSMSKTFTATASK